jgi:SAM-dependent methyltransferase
LLADPALYFFFNLLQGEKMIVKAFYGFLNLVPTMKRVRSHFWYEYVSRTLKRDPVLFMNYGYLNPYSAEQLPLQAADEANRNHIQLYHHVAAAVDLCGKNVLEIGCGRGGGSSYIQRYLHPHSTVGVDRTAAAIAFCQAHYQVPGLAFKQSDAEKLDFADGSFDAVVNLESSHCYASMETFLSEVRRVLRPGGHFLFADLRPAHEINLLASQLAHSGLDFIGSQVITFQVLRSMQASSEARRAMALRYLPFFLHGLGAAFVGADGSPTFTEMKEGNTVYKSYVLRKPSAL